MSQKLKLNTSLKDFEELHKLIDAHRKNAVSVKLPRNLVMNLLMDHSLLWDKVKKSGVEIDDTGTSVNTQRSPSEGPEQEPGDLSE